MAEEKNEQAADDERQDPLVHEGVPADPRDSNEKGDEKADVRNPDGGPVPRP